MRVVILALGLWLMAALPASAQDASRGRQLFQLCAACHGAAGEGQRQFGAPAIAGLPHWYVEEQLGKFRRGLRGFRPEDAAGLQMRPMARALTEADARAVAAFVAGLPPARPRPTLAGGDPEQGRAAYAPCTACHGERAAGNPALRAPALAGQADWYLADQLRKFRQGLRGTHPEDLTGAQMRPMALALADEAAIRNVIAYIRSLGR